MNTNLNRFVIFALSILFMVVASLPSSVTATTTKRKDAEQALTSHFIDNFLAKIYSDNRECEKLPLYVLRGEGKLTGAEHSGTVLYLSNTKIKTNPQDSSVAFIEAESSLAPYAVLQVQTNRGGVEGVVFCEQP